MELEEVRALALAVAKANGHPKPSDYADAVLTHYVAPAKSDDESKGKPK